MPRRRRLDELGVRLSVNWAGLQCARGWLFQNQSFLFHVEPSSQIYISSKVSGSDGPLSMPGGVLVGGIFAQFCVHRDVVVDI